MPPRSPLLQLEAVLVDAAGGIDREHELQVDRGLRRRGQGGAAAIAATSSAASVLCPAGRTRSTTARCAKTLLHVHTPVS